MSSRAGSMAPRRSNVQQVMWIVLFLNLAVALAKVVVGELFGSAAVKADGIHSTFDAVSNVVGLVGLALAARPADESHPYGHGKYEAFASAFIGCLLLLAACEVGWSAIQTLLTGVSDVVFSPLTVVVMVVTICVNVCVTTYERRMGEKYGSALLAADAKHTLSDVLVSASVIVGLVFVALGFPVADSIAALVVTAAILSAAVSVFKDVNDVFSDEARIDADELAACVDEVPGVRSCHRVRTRGMEGEVYADLHVLVDSELSIERAHEVGEAVEAHVKERYPHVVDVLVHLEPDTPEERAEGLPAGAADARCPSLT